MRRPAEGFDQNPLIGGVGYLLEPGMALSGGWMWTPDRSGSTPSCS